jgi:hypothetical protein
MADVAKVNHTGRELELMLAGKKPLAMFYDEVSHLPNEEIIPEAAFAPYVSNGQFVREEHFVEGAYDPRLKRNVRVLYVFFAHREEAWRIPAMILSMSTRSRVQNPNEALDRLEGALLGYTEQEIDDYCAYYRKPAA